MLEDCSALLIDVVLTCLNRLVRSGVDRAASAEDQVVTPDAIGVEASVHHPAGLLGGLEEHAARAVAEEGAGSAVGVVDEGRHLLRRDDEDTLVAARADVVRTRLQRVDEAWAGGDEVEGKGIDTARIVCHDGGRRREGMVACIGRQDEPIDGLRIDAAAGEEVLDGLHPEVSGALGRVLEDATLLDAYARSDPFIVGIYQLLQVGIGQLVLWQVAADGCDGCVDYAHS